MCVNLKYISRQGKYKETNYNGRKGEKYDIEIYAKCGHCTECINEKANNWVIRNHYESLDHEKKCFITLTYKDNPKFLIRKHVQDFMKRFRRYTENKIKLNLLGKTKKINVNKVRVFYAGEYGTLYHRPHYHIIIYGWEEEQNNLTYGGINKKGNIYYFSKIINKCWKFGRATYQKFNDYEIPYITLYETAKEQERFEYVMNREKAKQLVEELKHDKKAQKSYVHYKAMLYELEKTIKEQEKNKKDYYTFKEFNGWSLAMGWDKWFENVMKYKDNYDWQEYIQDKAFYTPTSWIKKLANHSHYKFAVEEMKRRALLVTELGGKQGAIAESNKNKIMQVSRHKDGVLKWQEKKQKTEL